MAENTIIRDDSDSARQRRNTNDSTGSEVMSTVDELVIPVVAEELTVETTRVARGSVRVHKRVDTREETVDAPVVHEDVVIERVTLNVPVDGAAPEPREEDGVLIIPILEEVVVVEKRLILREEVRVSRRRTTTNASQVVTLRREVVEVERVEAGEPPDSVAKDAARVNP